MHGLKKLILKLIPISLRIKLLKGLRKWTLRGDNVHCPLCAWSFLCFLPFGVKLRHNAMCPNCESLERHRFIWLSIEERLHKAQTVLHVAPEACLHPLISKQGHIKYHCCDKYPQSYPHCPQIEEQDILNTSYNDAQFDMILCNHVLEHIEEDQRAVEEFCRILKPQGTLLLSVPIDDSLEKTYEDFSIQSEEGREKAFGQKDHVRVYGRDFASKLQSYGLDVQELHCKDQFSLDQQERYGLLEDESLFVCTPLAKR